MLSNPKCGRKPQPGTPMTRERLDALAALAQAGDRAALEAVAVGVVRWCRVLAKKTARRFPFVDREELEQEGMVMIVAALRKWDASKGGFLNYFSFAAARAMSKLGQARGRKHLCQMVPVDRDGNTAGDLLTVEPAEAETDARADLEAAVRALPRRQRAAFAWRYGLFGRKPHTEGDVCKRMRLPRGQVQAALRRARRALRDALARAGYAVG